VAAWQQQQRDFLFFLHRKLTSKIAQLREKTPFPILECEKCPRKSQWKQKLNKFSVNSFSCEFVSK
jgi:hypothetical protein